jgi:hypothetical protein
MTGCDQEEYIALRATIRERGTARISIFVVGLIAWAALTVATAALASPPVVVLLPLLILAATFEAVFALHVGVERIGRYLQVFHEDHWEHAAMAFGRPAGAIPVDPLFSMAFLIAALFNLTPILVVNPVPVEWVFVGGAHALFVLRVIVARAAAGRQRAIDLARFQELKSRG